MVNNSDTKVSYRGNGQTTVFPFSFPFIQRDYIKVAIYDSLTDETKTIDSDYYVDTVANTVIYPGYEPGQEPAEALRPPILPATSTITIYRQTDVDQLTDLGAKYPLKDIENMADKLTEIIQEQAEKLGRTVKVPVGDPKTPEEKLTDLQNYVKAAADSAADAATSEASAQRAAEAAATSEANAAESERLAGGYADTATDAASRAEDSAISARAYNAPDYDTETTYQAGDVVTYTDGNSYRALQETTGNEPPNIIYWQKVTDYVGDDFFEVDEYGYIVPMDSPSHSRYWRVDQNGYIVPIEGGDGGYRPDTRQLSAEYLNIANEGYVKHLRVDDIAAQEVDADEVTAQSAAFTTVAAGTLTAPNATITNLTAQNATINNLTAGTITADDVIAKGPVVDVRAYGAVGDGVHDDTAAFRNAANAADGKTLIIPKGTYNISDYVIVNTTTVIDNGTYTNVKPAYPSDKVYIKTMQQFDRLANLQTGDATLDSWFTQGICYNSKTNKILVGLKGDDDTAQTIAVFNGNTYAYETSYNYTELGHVDTLTYVPETNEIYVDWIDTYKIQILDADTMAIKDSITTSYKHYGVAYDSVCHLFVAVDYITSSSYRLYISDSSFNLLYTKDIILPFAGTKNGIEAHDGKVIFFLFNGVVECDIFGNLLHVIKTNDENGFVVELEDITFSNGKFLTIANPNKQLFEIRELTKEEFNGPVKVHTYSNDLNDLLDSGDYRCIVNDTATAQSYHYPFDKWETNNYTLSGIVNTINAGWLIKQIFLRIGDGDFSGKNSYQMYERQYNDIHGAWTDWVRVDSPVEIKFGSEFIKASANGYTERTVTFDAQFKQVPIIQVSIFTETTATDYTNVMVFVKNVSASSFVIRVLNMNTYEKSQLIYWTAFGKR